MRYFPLGFVLGLIIGVIITAIVQERGGKVKIELKWPPSFEYDACGAPHQVPINFGRPPSVRSLGEALKIVEERTQGRGPARIFVDKKILDMELTSAKVHPPAGSQPSLDVVKQLVASANASDKIQICLVPEGGYRVCPK
jgi:hypothetical protein